MKILRYFIEFIVLFFVIWGFNAALNYFLQKKMKPTAAAFCVFIIVGILLFISVPYVVTFFNPALFYMPILLFWLVVNLVESNKSI